MYKTRALLKKKHTTTTIFFFIIIIIFCQITKLHSLSLSFYLSFSTVNCQLPSQYQRRCCRRRRRIIYTHARSGNLDFYSFFFCFVESISFCFRWLQTTIIRKKKSIIVKIVMMMII